MPNPKSVVPLDESSLRQILVGWGAGLMCTSLGFIIGGLFVPYLGFFLGGAIALRGHLPSLFAKHIHARIIAGTPYQRKESIKIWSLAVIACLLLAELASWTHHKIAPEKPDLLRNVLEVLNKTHDQTPVASVVSSAPVSHEAAPIVPDNPDSPVSATCSLPIDRSSCGLHCVVTNSGNVTATSTAVGFVLLPVGAHVTAFSDLQITLVKADGPPPAKADPNLDPKDREGARTFFIRIPVLLKHSSVAFDLWNDNSDNMRVCAHMTRVEAIRRTVAERALTIARSTSPKKRLPKIDDLIAAKDKSESLYQPDTVTSEFGRRDVSYISANESAAMNSAGDFMNPIPEAALRNLDVCAPWIITYERTDGSTFTQVNIPWGVAIYSDNTVLESREKKTADGKVRTYITFKPPAQYICVPNPTIDKK